KPPAGRVPWDKPKALSNAPKNLFSLKLMTNTIDEGQNFRNCGSKHAAVLEILEHSTIRQVLTATPLQTSTKDIAAMGRMVGLPHFLSDQAWLEEKQDQADLRAARREIPDDYNPLVIGEADDPVTEVQNKIAERLRTQFEGRVVRRTVASLNWNLPPIQKVIAPISPRPWEAKTLSILGERVKDNVSMSNSILKIVSNSFYIEYRMGASWPRMTQTDDIPTFKSLEEWNQKGSIKYTVAAELIRHYLSRDDVEDVIFSNGQAVFPQPTDAASSTPSQNNKILVYQEFTSLGPLFRNVLDLYGIIHLSIDSNTPFDRRAEVVKKFCEEDEFRVLIFSSIGSVGLNLSRANIVVFLVRSPKQMNCSGFNECSRISRGPLRTSGRYLVVLIDSRRRRLSRPFIS
ncbi:hypothetical protein CPB83DRAFT_757111, partial [Crepidotus variabilis]